MLYEIYGTYSCNYCQKAKQLLLQHDKAFVFIDVAESDKVTAAFFDRFPGVSKVPQIVLGEEHIGGYTELEKSLTLDEIESIL